MIPEMRETLVKRTRKTPQQRLQSFFQKGPIELYDVFEKIVSQMHNEGSFILDIKKNYIHLKTPYKAAFIGFHPTSRYLGVRLISSVLLEHPLLQRTEALFHDRVYNLFHFQSPHQLDEDFWEYVRYSYQLMNSPQAQFNSKGFRSLGIL